MEVVRGALPLKVPPITLDVPVPPPSERVGEEVGEFETMGENDVLALPVPAIANVKL